MIIVTKKEGFKTVNGMEACVTWLRSHGVNPTTALEGFKTVNGMEACVTVPSRYNDKRHGN